MTKPLVDQARVRFQGLSQEAFDVLPMHDEVTFTVRGIVVKHEESAMTDEGVRVSQTVRIVRVVEGISEAVKETPDGQMALGDYDTEEDDDSDANVIAGGFSGGPNFSDAPR